jgi:site-specific DNA-methyltransferase (adenine-specific)
LRPGNMSTTETVIKQTIDWRTLRSYASQITRAYTVKAVILAGGFQSSACHAAQCLTAVFRSMSATQELFALDSAIDSGRISRPEGIEAETDARPIILARAPLDGTNAHNALTHGCGGLWIDGGRIDASGRPLREHTGRSGNIYGSGLEGSRAIGTTTQGRWPANLILDPEAAALLDAQSGELKSGARSLVGHEKPKGVTSFGGCDDREYRGDSGGASRFFYVAKPSRAERNAGLTGEGRKRDASRNADQPSMHGGNGNPYNRGAAPVRNHHPTVKPVALMRHLLRLTRPPSGGVVLDPFCGSGTTGIAAVLEDRDFVGVDISQEYCDLARARVDHAKRCPWDFRRRARAAQHPRRRGG